MPATFTPRFADDRAGGSPYPFGDGCSLRSGSGVTLPADGFVDALVYPRDAGTPVGLRRVEVSGGRLTFWVGGPGRPLAASCVVQPEAPGGAHTLVDPEDRLCGCLVLDAEELLAAVAWPEGTHDFPAGAADFVDRCVVPWSDRAVTAVRVGNQLLSGLVFVVGDHGVVAGQDTVNTDANMLRLDAVGDPLFRRRQCSGGDPASFPTPRFVRRVRVINPDLSEFTVEPDEYGEILIVPAGWTAADTTLRIRPDGADGLRFEAAGFGGP